MIYNPKTETEQKLITQKIEQNKIAEEQEQTQTEETSFGNISIENATYLQNMENGHNNIDTKTKSDEELPHFEVDSIELANPQLFSDDKKDNPSSIINISGDDCIAVVRFNNSFSPPDNSPGFI